MVLVFLGSQFWLNRLERPATISPRLIQQKTLTFVFVFNVLMGGAWAATVYTLPLWLQTVQGKTVLQSGIYTLPFAVAFVVGAFVFGAVVSKTKRTLPWVFVCATLMSIGSGVMTTLRTDTGFPSWMICQVIFAFGLGIGTKLADVMIQDCAAGDYLSDNSLLLFGQSFGGAIFVCFSQAFITEHLASAVPSIFSIDKESVFAAGATGIVQAIPTGKLASFLVVYNDALVRAMYVILLTSLATILPIVYGLSADLSLTGLPVSLSPVTAFFRVYRRPRFFWQKNDPEAAISTT